MGGGDGGRDRAQKAEQAKHTMAGRGRTSQLRYRTLRRFPQWRATACNCGGRGEAMRYYRGGIAVMMRSRSDGFDGGRRQPAPSATAACQVTNAAA